MNEQEAENLIDNDEQEERFEEQQEQQDDYDNEFADVPTHKKPDSLYTLFQKVWRAPDSSKVGNLHKDELGKVPLMSVRDAQYLALLGSTLKHPKFARFFNTVGEITLKTSASKKGWFTELFVSQKKFTQRSNNFGGAVEQQSSQKKGKWNLLNLGKEEEPQKEE